MSCEGIGDSKEGSRRKRRVIGKIKLMEGNERKEGTISRRMRKLRT